MPLALLINKVFSSQMSFKINYPDRKEGRDSLQKIRRHNLEFFLL